MNRLALLITLTTFLCPPTLHAEWVPPSERARARHKDSGTQGQVHIPSKWYKGARGYEKAIELQKSSNADLFIYFIRPNTPDEKGLCSWFENKGIKSLPMRQLLREYLKVKVPLPANPKNQELAEKFNVRKTPAVFVIHPDGWRNRCTVFHWDKKPLKLLDPEELTELIRLSSSEKYHPTKKDTEPIL